MNSSAEEKARSIRAVVFDVDGVLTRGDIIGLVQGGPGGDDRDPGASWPCPGRRRRAPSAGLAVILRAAVVAGRLFTSVDTCDLSVCGRFLFSMLRKRS